MDPRRPIVSVCVLARDRAGRDEGPQVAGYASESGAHRQAFLPDQIVENAVQVRHRDRAEQPRVGAGIEPL